MKSTFPVWNRELRSMMQVNYTEHLVLKKITENGRSQIFTFFGKPCRKDL